MFKTKDENINEFKYVSRSKAKVIDNNDPLKRGRIIVDHPLLGETVWIDYLKVPGSFNIPSIGDIVYIECDSGFASHPIAWGNVTFGKDDSTDIPEQFQRIDPTNRGFYSPGGHFIEIDDGSDLTGKDTGIRITTSNGSILHIKDEPTDNSINVETVSGAKFNIDGTNDSITAEVTFGDNLELSAANGFQVDTPAAGGTHLSQKNGKIDLTSTLDSSFKVSAGNLELEAVGGAKLKLGAGKVGLGGPAGELIDQASKLADELSKLALADSISIHPTAVGPSGPPTNAATMVAVSTAALAIKAILDLIKGGI